MKRHRGTLIVAAACLLAGATGGFVAGRVFPPDMGLVVPEVPDNDMMAYLTIRGIGGDPGGSMGSREFVVTTCDRAPDRLDCMKRNYPLLVIGAENGEADGMIATATALTGSRHCRDLDRAGFWLWKAQGLGKDVRAQKTLLAEKQKSNCVG